MVQYTPNQQKAIDHFGHNILVAASAGSGKTAVLVQRVLREIQTIDVDDLLIVTFTRAAAEEMRSRIQAAVSESIATLQAKTDLSSAQKTQLAHDRRQMNRLNLANISTIDAFCQQVIHKFYYLIHVDPGFDILADAAQATLWQQQVFESIREAYYNANDQIFFQLTDNFSNDRDDEGLQTLVFKLYDYMRVSTNPQDWLQHLPEPYDMTEPLLKTPLFSKTILPQLRDLLTKTAQDLLVEEATLAAAGLTRYAQLEADAAQRVEALATALPEATYQQLHEQLKLDLSRWPRMKNDENPLADLIKAQEDRYKKHLEDIQTFWETYFVLPEARVAQIHQKAHLLLLKLVEVVQKFSDAYQALKASKQLLDFGDLEHDAYAILEYEDEQGQRPAQLFYQSKFAEVLIDEYQDINPLQESLLALVAKPDPGNRFMVGDIKQSIYGFRMADPGLFAAKYVAYQDDATDSDERIILAENFRSKKSIDDFTNYIFAQLMTQDLGAIEYDEAAYLKFGASYYPTANPVPIEVLLAQTNPDLPVDNPSIQVLVARIQALIAAKTPIFDGDTGENRPITYGDIAILVRSRYANLELMDAFKAANIPLIVRDTQNYFQTTELRIMLALLSIIDNPDQDIPLTAVLRSPMYQFDENELGFIRGYQEETQASYYECVQKVLADSATSSISCRPDFLKRLETFMAELNHYRDLARQDQIADLIWSIYETTGFLDYVSGMPAGPQRSANLNALYQRALAYERSGFKGVFQFVRFIQEMQKNDKDLAQPNAVDPTTDAVSVVTIHKSKGLEFPVVFVFGLEHQFNTQDQKGRYVLSPDNGIGMAVLDDNRVLVPTLPKHQITAEIAQKNLAEELRLLYVAMTRAQQQLILVANIKDQDPERILQTWANQAGTQLQLPLDTKLGAKSLLDFIGPALIRGSDQPELVQYRHGDLFTALPHDFKLVLQQPEASGQVTSDVAQTLPQEVIQVDPAFTKAVARRLNFVYPQGLTSATSAYQSVSDIKRQFDDPDLNLLQPLTVEDTPAVKEWTAKDLQEPAFLKATDGVSATQVGTAAHLVLQQLDLTQPVTSNLISETISKLTDEALLNPQVAQRIDQKGILAFFETDLGQLILQHPEGYHREVTFSMVYPAEKLFPEIGDQQAGNVLIHGMMDGYYEDAAQLILVDYKTDHAKPATIVKRYSGQVNLYALALAQMAQRPVDHGVLYSFVQQKLIPVF